MLVMLLVIVGNYNYIVYVVSRGTRFIWTSKKIVQLVKKTAWWFNTVWFWQWCWFMSFFF